MLNFSAGNLKWGQYYNYIYLTEKIYYNRDFSKKTSLLQLHTFYCMQFITKTFLAQNLSVFVATLVKIVPYIIQLKNHSVHICNIGGMAPNNSIITSLYVYKLKNYVHQPNIWKVILKHYIMSPFLCPMLQMWTL